MLLRVTRKGHSRGNKNYAVGDVFEGTERELAAFGDRLERVEEPAPSAGDPKPSESKPAASVDYITKPGGWYEFSDGVKVRGKDALEAELARRSKG